MAFMKNAAGIRIAIVVYPATLHRMRKSCWSHDCGWAKQRLLVVCGSWAL